MSPEQSDQLLALVGLRQANGKDYKPNSLDTYVSVVKSHLAELGHYVAKFEMVSKVVSTKKGVKSRGLGNPPNGASGLTPDEKEQMWANGHCGQRPKGFNPHHAVPHEGAMNLGNGNRVTLLSNTMVTEDSACSGTSN